MRNQDLEATFRALPTFLDESRLTLNRLGSFSRNANPLITQLHPSARLLSANLKQVAKVAPSFNSFFIGLRKLAKRSVTGLPSLRTLLDTDLPPLLTEITPFSRQITPIVAGVGRYQSDVTGFLGNVASALNATGTIETGQNIHYIRSSAPLYPDSLGTFPSHRLSYSRANPYPAPNSALKVANGLDTFDTRACSAATGLVAQPQSARQRLHRESVLQQPRDLRHPAGAPRRHQEVRLRRAEPEHDRGRVPLAGVHEVAAAALDRADQRVDRLHARLRESLSRSSPFRIATD